MVVDASGESLSTGKSSAWIADLGVIAGVCFQLLQLDRETGPFFMRSRGVDCSGTTCGQTGWVRLCTFQILFFQW